MRSSVPPCSSSLARDPLIIVVSGPGGVGKALTLPHLPSLVAFTIRAWSRRTFWWTLCQSMACQSTGRGRPHQQVDAAVICFASLVGLSSSLVMRDPVEVCPLSRGVMLLMRNPYPGDYSPAFAFSTVLYPQPRRRILRLPTRAGGLRAYRVRPE